MKVGDEVKYPSGKGVVVIDKPDSYGVIIVIEYDYDDCGASSYKRVSAKACVVIK